MGKSRLSLFSVILIISVLWKPVYSKDKCSIECQGSPSNPAFVQGNKYSYSVEGTVTIFLSPADDQETSVKLIGQVSVDALANCVHELSVQNLVISGPDGKKYQPPPGIDKVVRFGFQDGRVGPEICAHGDDTRRSLNIKRAIISLLQTEQKPSTQVDVFGVCPTEVSSSQEGSAVLVHRTRDLSRCSHREQGKNDIITSITNPDAGIKDMQVLQSILNVESKVNSGVPEKVSATEEYLYKPFSVGENGARAKVHTKLTLTGKSSCGQGVAYCTESRSIIFDNPHGVKPVPGNANSALAAVKDVAKSVSSIVESKSAGAFAQLIRILRITSKDDLMKVYSQVKGSNLEKRVFLDALLRAGTGDSIEASINILKSRELGQLEQQLVYLSLGNARHVNNAALKAAASLLDQPNLPKEVYLGVGALAGAYCREHECHTTKPEGIVALSQKLGAKLQNCRPRSKTEEDTIVAILKGIRSIRHLEDSLINKIVHCAADNNVKARVKAAALEAFHADPCSAAIKKTAIEIMKNRQLDSEIRIKAYLAVIQCPCGQSANEIKNLLDTEPVHQVGNFISTSLRYIRTSANPDKQLARQHYGLIRTPNKFNSDDRKYSFYRETSFNIDALGAGGSVDQTVIYSQDSYLPREASVNLTVELFGHSYNVLELGGRQGNLDRVIEHFLGPKGYFRTSDPQALYDDLVKRYEESKNKVQHGFGRGRRSIKNEIDNFDKNLKAESNSYHNELDLDIYVKLFGTDAVFLSFGDDKGFDFNKILDEILGTCNSGINKLKHFQQELRTHLLFMDAELSYPTSVGLPLRLNLVGSLTARLDVATNVDIQEIMKSPQSAKVDVKFVPSTDVEIAGALLIDADSVTTGLKVITNLRSSTGLHVIAKVIENGRGFDLQLGLPVDKQEILVASNELVYVTAEKGQREKQTKIKTGQSMHDYSPCFDQLSGVLGLTLCGHFSLPFSISNREKPSDQIISQFFNRFPLSGTASAKIVLEKNDLQGYHIKGVVREDAAAGKKSFEFLFDAEGSQNRHTKLTGQYVYNSNEIGVKLELQSPIKNLYGEISACNNPRELMAKYVGRVDSMEYKGRIGFTVQGNEQRSVYRPVFEYSIPDGSGQTHSAEIVGEVIKETSGRKSKYTARGLQIPMAKGQQPVEVNGYVSLQDQPRDVEVDLAVKGYASLKGSLKGSDVMIDFENNLNPNVNFNMKGKFDYNNMIHNEFELQYGPKKNDPLSKVSFFQHLKYHIQSSEDYNIITKNSFEIRAVPLKVVANADIDPKKVVIDIGGQYVDRSAKLEVEARTKIKRPGDYSVKVKANLNDACIEVLSKRDVVSADKSNFENYLDITGVGRYELSGVVLHKTKPNDMNVGAIGHFKIKAGSNNEDIKFDIGLIETSNIYSSHAQVSNSKGEVLDFLLKVTRTGNPTGQLKFNLKDIIVTHGEFKVTDNDGKGNGMIIVEFKKLQRKIKGDVKFVSKDPVFITDIELYLDFEKNNNNKFHFVTNNRKTQKLVSSKNKVEYDGKVTEVNYVQEGVFSITGKTNLNFDVVLPTERCISLKIDRDVALKDGKYSGHAELLLSDSVKRGSASSVISYKGKIVDTDIEKEIINYEGQLEFRLKDGKQLLNTFYLKNIPEGNKFKFDFKSDVTGNLLPKPASLSATGSYLDSETIINQNYRVKGNYGDDISFEYVDQWDVQLFEKDKKYLSDYTVTVHLPFEKAHDIKWASTVQYLQPDGKDIAEYTIVESVQVNADVFKVDANGKVGIKNGSGAIKVLIPHNDPFIVDFNYKRDSQGDKNNNFVEVKAKYGKGKTTSLSIDSSFAPHDSTLQVKAYSPNAEKLKKLELNIHSKNPSPDTYSNSIIMDADGRIYKSESTIVLSKAHPVLDIQYVNPETNKPSRIYVKGSSLSSTQGKIEVKVDNIYKICFDVVAEGSVQKDNVAFKAVANSKELGWNNYNVDISSKDSGNGKRLDFHAINDNKNVISGSTSFISKQEGQKTIIEGSGSVKLREEQKSANFKFIRTVLTESSEQGVETFFNVAIGERSYVAESRVTNYEYKNSYVYCEEKKQCAHAEIQSKIDMSTPGVIVNLVNIGFDLRKLGVAPELGLQMRDEVSTSKPPRFTLDLHVNSQERKYHLHAYNTPEHGHFASGVTVRLPSRLLALEYTLDYPTDKLMPFPVRGEVCLDLDKNKPGHKTSARFLVDFTNAGGSQDTAIAEIGFFHPKIEKEAVFRINGVVKRPGDGTFKFETSATLSCHSAFGRDRVSKLLLEVSPRKFEFLAETPFVKVLHIDAGFTSTPEQRTYQSLFSVCLLEGNVVQIKTLLKDFQYFEFTTEESGCKFSVVAHLVPEKRADISADLILSGGKKNIAHGALFLKDNTIQSEYGASKDNFNHLMATVKKDAESLNDRIKDLGEKSSQDFQQLLQRATPYFKRIDDDFRAEWERFYNEIAVDKVFKELSHTLNEVIHYLAKIFDEILQGTKPLVDQITKTFTETSEKISGMYKKTLEPQLKQLYETLGKILKEYLDAAIEVVAHLGALVSDFFEKHKQELQQLTNVMTEIFKDLTRIIVAQLKEMPGKFNQVYGELVQLINNMPIIEAIKEKWKDGLPKDQILGMYNQGYAAIYQVLPNKEFKDFAEALNNYVIKKLRSEQIDDAKSLQVIYQKLIAAFSSLSQFIPSQITSYTASGPTSWSSYFFSPASTPVWSGDASWSLLKQLISGDLPDMFGMIRVYRPRSLDPFDEMPAKLRAVVINGQHIFTFDGKHLTFPGQCRYVLIHDYVDRNFTVLLQLQNGQPKALVLEDKSGTIIELKDNGQVTLNGAVHGFPVIEKDVFAFKQTNGRIGLGSQYGFKAFCTSKLEVCYFEVNGFYLGKLRGLLGDGNNEPYDDFRLPNGKICTSESEFGNGYGLVHSCPKVQAPEHSHHQMHAALPPACEQVFGGISPLRPVSLLLDVSPFRQACIHAVTGADAAKDLHQACDLARGYAALALTGMLPAVLPDVCVRCTDADKPRAIGDMYEVKMPNKQADIVVSFETTQNNEQTYKELVMPLVTQLVDNLKKKQITDIKLYLVGHTSKHPYAILYDTDLKLKSSKLHFDDTDRYDRTPYVKTGFETFDKYEKNLVEFIDAVKIKLGITNIAFSEYSLMDLPFRAGAVKHVFLTVSEPCIEEFFLVKVVGDLMFKVLLENMGMSMSLVTATPEMKCGGNLAHVVGFDESSVLMLGNMKRTKESEALRATLELPSSSCIDFTQAVDGLVFSSTNYLKLEGGQRKQFLQTAANAITQKMTKAHLVQECTCTYVDPFRVRSACFTREKKEVARRRK